MPQKCRGVGLKRCPGVILYIIFQIFLGHQNPGPDNNIGNISEQSEYCGFSSSSGPVVMKPNSTQDSSHLLLGILSPVHAFHAAELAAKFCCH
jgi:hypothetical protein